MKLNLFFKFLTLVIFFISPNVFADIENDLKKITSKIRCMTCQNQTVYSSDTDFALNIKKIVKNKLQNNKSEKEIIDFLVYRYGEYILFEPKMSKQKFLFMDFSFFNFSSILSFFLLSC